MIKKRRTIFYTEYYRYQTGFLRFDKSEFSFVAKILKISISMIKRTSSYYPCNMDKCLKATI